MLAQARGQLAAYPQATIVEGQAVDVRAGRDFTVTLASGEGLDAARLILAYGITDVLPEIPGLAERWGKSVLHCPYCHGYEFADGKLGVLAVSPMSAHQALLIAEWGPTTLYLNGGDMPDEATCAQLARRGVGIEPAPVTALVGEGGTLSGLRLGGRAYRSHRRPLPRPQTRMNSPLAERLGCMLDEGPFGPVIRTDAAKLTTVAGVVCGRRHRAGAPQRELGRGGRCHGGCLGPPVPRSCELSCLIVRDECRVRFGASIKRP